MSDKSIKVLPKLANSRMRPFFAWSRSYLYAILSILFTAAGLGVVLWLVFDGLLIIFIAVVLIPMVLAVISVTSSLFTSGYVQVVGELSRRNKEKAGLGYIRSKNGKVLLNKQVEFPWKNQWLLPGGYFNRDKGDKDPRDTATRRVMEIVKPPVCTFAAQVKIAYTNGSFQYEQDMVNNGHTPLPIQVYLVLKADQSDILETDVVESQILQWVSPDEIERDDLTIPVHIKELLYFLLEPKSETSSLRYWEMDQEYTNFYLTQEA